MEILVPYYSYYENMPEGKKVFMFQMGKNDLPTVFTQNIRGTYAGRIIEQTPEVILALKENQSVYYEN